MGLCRRRDFATDRSGLRHGPAGLRHGPAGLRHGPVGHERQRRLDSRERGRPARSGPKAHRCSSGRDARAPRGASRSSGTRIPKRINAVFPTACRFRIQVPTGSTAGPRARRWRISAGTPPSPVRRHTRNRRHTLQRVMGKQEACTPSSKGCGSSKHPPSSPRPPAGSPSRSSAPMSSASIPSAAGWTPGAGRSPRAARASTGRASSRGDHRPPVEEPARRHRRPRGDAPRGGDARRGPLRRGPALRGPRRDCSGGRALGGRPRLRRGARSVRRGRRVLVGALPVVPGDGQRRPALLDGESAVRGGRPAGDRPLHDAGLAAGVPAPRAGGGPSPLRRSVSTPTRFSPRCWDSPAPGLESCGTPESSPDPPAPRGFAGYRELPRRRGSKSKERTYGCLRAPKAPMMLPTVWYEASNVPAIPVGTVPSR